MAPKMSINVDLMEDHNKWIHYINDLLYLLKSAWMDHKRMTIVLVNFEGHGDQLFAFFLPRKELPRWIYFQNLKVVMTIE